MIYFCCDKLRRNAVRASPLSGIDFLEVLDRDAPPGSPRQQTLLVRLLKPVPAAFGRENVRLDGGERIRPVRVAWAFAAPAIPADLLTAAETAFFSGLPDANRVLVVRTDVAGDFSTYRLSLRKSATDDTPPDGFDPLLVAADFSFKVECPGEFDCRRTQVCPPEPRRAEPEIDYLAKDYASFRRLMLDRMAALLPQWTERNPADLGVTLVELLAYAADHLSYGQDAVATEAYLKTARRRVSVRRHARLVDYAMHDGCNARAWVQIAVSSDLLREQPANPPAVPRGTRIFSRLADQPPHIAPAALPALRTPPEAVFETLAAAENLFAAHNEMTFHTWGDKRCCLPRGATCATLRDGGPDPAARLRLRAGDVLIFEERLGPVTGLPADADPTRRHVVRLTRVAPEAERVMADGVEVDRIAGPLRTDILTGETIVEIEWDATDALPFPLCISSVAATGEELENVSVALGNIVPADHGITAGAEPLGTVPEPVRSRLPRREENGGSGDDRCKPARPEPIFPRFRPVLKLAPITQAAPFDASKSAAAAMHRSLRECLPAITLTSELGGVSREWHPRRDLLNSRADAPEFVVEIETDGTATLRFGDDRHGARPEPGTVFHARYRVGNGAAGNVGADTLAHVVLGTNAITRVRNPLPARGGVEPESVADVRQRAPAAFRTQERAVTEADYAEVAGRHPGVQRAAATFRWTGSWHTVFLTVDRTGGREVDGEFEREVRAQVERFRMAGHDLEVDAPQFVPVELAMRVCVKPEYFRSDVKAALLELFSNRVLPDGRRGLFHPDRFTFGQPVYLGPLIAAAQTVPGVASVHVTRFGRQRTPGDPEARQTGQLALGRLEIARLDNDPNFPEHGVLRLNLGGGK